MSVLQETGSAVGASGRGMDINETDNTGKTPLHLAIEAGNTHCQQLLADAASQGWGGARSCDASPLSRKKPENSSHQRI
ncbi:ankyrin repeat domain-containing protein [Endozoicomonas sp. SESOKO1]|uniref:ankyrin repeat domain-containing protein n=1 Tax=Endozoicomonas sp. SESOKO1 TaxID=2828742 RepID=UPI0021491F0F|nr:ankyrin repeat domain-containing protein [Endozoicomonas sp. SESOKO1]